MEMPPRHLPVEQKEQRARNTHYDHRRPNEDPRTAISLESKRLVTATPNDWIDQLVPKARLDIDAITSRADQSPQPNGASAPPLLKPYAHSGYPWLEERAFLIFATVR